MKRVGAVCVLCVLVMTMLSACGSWMSGEYLSVKPYEVRLEQNDQQVIDVASYSQLRNVIRDLVADGSAGGLISISSFHEAVVDFYVNSAINHVKNNTPIGAYAVKEISYEIGTNRGDSVVAVQIEYLHNRTEIKSIKQVSSNEQMLDAVKTAMADNESYLVLYIEDYSDVDFADVVSAYGDEHPELIMEIPQVNTFSYPERGQERVVEIYFTYQTDSETLQEMQKKVQAVFSSAELYVRQMTKVMDIYTRLYSFLMGGSSYKLESSITPAYSLLYHGVGDSRTFANVYAAMCRNADLECQVISGTRDGEPWYWNQIRFRGSYYHVDLLRCYEQNEFVIKRDSEMVGYVWGYSPFS